jgi:hypothetical protein
MKRIVIILAAALSVAGCHKTQPQSALAQRSTTGPVPAPQAAVAPATEPAPIVTAAATESTSPHDRTVVVPPTPVVEGVVAKKPFFASPHPFIPAGAQPSPLLLLHARSDSPVPLTEFGKQKTFSIREFKLRPELSADELQKRLGPPAQLADYSDPWFVYRLGSHKELWLHFSQPDNARLLAADIVHSQEDGYTRDRIFPSGDAR